MPALAPMRCLTGASIARCAPRKREARCMTDEIAACAKLVPGSPTCGHRSYRGGERVRAPYSPIRSRRLARAYSRFILAMKLTLISAGQTASHS